MILRPTTAMELSWALFTASFVEGGAVMAVELIGAKLVAPFYGNSLYVWAAVLGLTLGGLMAGYLVGGILSRRFSGRSLLYLVMLLSAVLVALMPWVSAAIMEATLGLGLRLGVTLSCLVFLVPPLVCFGVVSPLIVRLVARPQAGIGHAAGMVYAVSTVGGIVVTFLVGFYGIPTLGLTRSALATAGLLALVPLIVLSPLRSSAGKVPGKQ